MKITVVGPGALGCLIAAYLKSRAKEDVWLLDYSPERAKKIRADGIKIESVNGASTVVKVDTTADPKDIGVSDLVIICVKSYSTEDVCKEIKDVVSSETHILTLQNGVGNVQILNDNFGFDRIVAGVTNHGATLVGVGHVKHAGKGETIIGKSDSRVLGPVRKIADLLTKAGFDTKVSKDIDSVIWSKLIINVGINAITAITCLNNGMIVDLDETRQILRGAVQEAVRIVKRKRIKLIYDDPIQKVESVCKSTSSNVSSMLQDVIKRKKTEIDFINGAIIRQGKSLGIPTPINEVLTNLVKALENTYDKTVASVD